MIGSADKVVADVGDVLCDQPNVGLILCVTCRRFHQTHPNLGLILGGQVKFPI